MAASLCAFIVLLISLSPLVVDSSCGYAPYRHDLCGLLVFFRCEHRIAAPVPALPSPPVPFLPLTNDARDHRADDRSQARCSTRAPQSSGANPHPEFHGCFRWHLHLLSSRTTFCFSSTLRTFPKLFIKTSKLANAVFWCCSYFW